MKTIPVFDAIGFVYLEWGVKKILSTKKWVLSLRCGGALLFFQEDCLSFTLHDVQQDLSESLGWDSEISL